MIEQYIQQIPSSIMVVHLVDGDLSLPEMVLLELKDINDLVGMAVNQPLFCKGDCLYLMPNEERGYILYAKGYMKMKKEAEKKAKAEQQ